MQNLKNCQSCGKLFLKVSRNICPDCFQEEEEEFMKVKKCLDDNPKATVATVSEETDVAVNKINKFIKEGRILASKYEGITLQCERCGKETTSGKYCDSCKDALQKDFQSIKGDVPKEESKKETGKIHIQNRLKRRR